MFPDGTKLTARQEQVVRLLDEGLTNSEIAERLGITLDGAKFHVTEIMNRFGVHSRDEAVRAWKQHTPAAPLGIPLMGFGKVAAVAVLATGAAVAIVVWAALLNRGIESRDATPDELAALQSAVESVNTAKFTMVTEFSAPGKPAESSTATGAVDFANDRAAFFPPDDGPEQIYADGVQYMRFGPEQKWRESPGGNGGLPDVLSVDHWREAMASAQDVQQLGTVRIRGVETVHYTFTTRPEFKSNPGLSQVFGQTRFEMDVWLGEGRLVRMEQHAVYEGTGTDMDGTKVFLRIDLSDWNEPVDIQTPSPDEIELTAR